MSVNWESRRVVNIAEHEHFCDYAEPSMLDEQDCGEMTSRKPGMQWDYFKIVSLLLALLISMSLWGLAPLFRDMLNDLWSLL